MLAALFVPDDFALFAQWQFSTSLCILRSDLEANADLSTHTYVRGIPHTGYSLYTATSWYLRLHFALQRETCHQLWAVTVVALLTIKSSGKGQEPLV
jgi:hypothetical protein